MGNSRSQKTTVRATSWGQMLHHHVDKLVLVISRSMAWLDGGDLSRGERIDRSVSLFSLLSAKNNAEMSDHG